MQNKVSNFTMIIGLLFHIVIGVLVLRRFKEVDALLVVALVWVVSVFIGFLSSQFKFIKVPFFSDIKDDFTSPVYRLEKGDWGDWRISKYIVEYSVIDDGRVLWFPLMMMFKFRQYSLADRVTITDSEYEMLIEGSTTPETIFEKEFWEEGEKIRKQQEEQERLKRKLREINKGYYGNFK